MNYGGIDTGSAGVLALLADTTRAGHGYGQGGPFGGFSANAVRADANGNLLNRNNQDAHFDALTSQLAQFAFSQQAQTNHFALAAQAQISQLALQACKCCGDRKAAVAKIEAKIDCISRSSGIEINLSLTQQSNQDLLGQLAILQSAANNNAQEVQHGEILTILGQIAGALANMDDGKHKKRRRRRHFDGLDEENGNGNGNGECPCGCKVHVDVNSHNTDTRGGGGGVEPEVVEPELEEVIPVPLPANGNGNGERVVVTEPAPTG